MSKIAEQRFERLLRQLLADRNAAKAAKGGGSKVDRAAKVEKKPATAPQPSRDSFESGPSGPGPLKR